MWRPNYHKYICIHCNWLSRANCCLSQLCSSNSVHWKRRSNTLLIKLAMEKKKFKLNEYLQLCLVKFEHITKSWSSCQQVKKVYLTRHWHKQVQEKGHRCYATNTAEHWLEWFLISSTMMKQVSHIHWPSGLRQFARPNKSFRLYELKIPNKLRI